MAKEKEPVAQGIEPTQDEDVEGNSLLIGSTMAGDMARIRSRELERAAREHARAKEAKDAKHR